MYQSCVVHITFQYPGEYTEVLPDNVESTEIAIEAGVSEKLAELFGGEILVDDVTLENVQEESASSD